MGTIISSGIGSGLDVAGLVQQLVAAEGQPKSVRLSTQEAKLQAKLSALGSLRSALADFDSSLKGLGGSSFDARRVTTSTSDFLSAVASTRAVPGSYGITVERLAVGHRLASAPYAAADTPIGTGSLTLAVGGQAFTVEIDASRQTLAGIRDAINAASDNAGISASIVNGVDGSRLLLSAVKTGIESRIVVTAAGGDGGLAALNYDPDNAVTNLSELDSPQNARILVSGFAAESSTNTFSDVIEGLEITVLATNEAGEETLVGVARDQKAAVDAVSKLVESYNTLMGTVSSATRFDVANRSGGPLLGDAGVRNLVLQLRREWSGTGGSPGALSLVDLGITTGLDGKLTLDKTKLEFALEADVEAVQEFFARTDTGLSSRLSSVLASYLEAGGVLDNRTDGLNSSLAAIKDSRSKLEERLVALEERLLKQFNALDSLMAELQGTSTFLQQQLRNLPGAVFANRNQ